jgi:hypothetical protein
MGTGKNAFFESLYRGTVPVQTIPAVFEATYSFKSRYYVPGPSVDPAAYGISSAQSKLIAESGRYAVVCAMTAIQDAGFGLESMGQAFSVTGGRIVAAFSSVSAWEACKRHSIRTWRIDA